MATINLNKIGQGINTATGLLNTANQIGSLFKGTPGGQANQGGFNLSSLTTPQGIAGAGLVGAGLAQKEEAGEVTQARQFLRNRFTSPTGISDQFGGQLEGLSQQFTPLLEAQEREQANQLSQRFAAAFPAQAGAQGAEFGGLAKQIGQEFLPRRQAALGDLALNLINTQGQAAQSVLESGRPDPLGQILAGLGANLIQGQGAPGVQGGLQPGQQPGQAGLPGDQSGLFNSALDAVTQANTTGDISGLLSLLQSGSFRGTPFPVGVNASTPAGQAIQQAINAGLVESPAATQIGLQGAQAGVQAGQQGVTGLQAAGTAGVGTAGVGTTGIGTTGTGLAAGAGALAAAGAGAAQAAFKGFKVGEKLPNEALAGGVGFKLGGVAGAIGGFFGNKSASQAQKDANRLADTDSQVAEARNYFDFFGPRLETIGVDLNSTIDANAATRIAQAIAANGGETPIFGSTEGRFKNLTEFTSFLSGKSLMDVTANLMQRVPNAGDQQGQILSILGGSLLAHAQANDASITSLNQVPGLRQEFLNVISESVLSPSRQSDVSGLVGLRG